MKKIQVRDDNAARIDVVDYVNVKSENSFLKAKDHVNSKTSSIDTTLSDLKNRVKNLEEANISKRKRFEFNITTTITLVGVIISIILSVIGYFV